MLDDLQATTLRCRDAEGRLVTVFNPLVRRGRVFGHAHVRLTPEQVRRLDAEGNLVSRWPIRKFIAFCFIALAVGLTMLASRQVYSQVPLWFAVALWAVVLATGVLMAAAVRLTVGRPLFRGTAREAADALIRAGHCPACAYPLPASDDAGLSRCPECGAVWHSSPTSSPSTARAKCGMPPTQHHKAVPDNSPEG